MAIWNESEVQRIQRFIQKYFGVKGSPPTVQVSGEYSLALPLYSGVENRYLEGWQRFGHTVGLVAGGAGTFNHIRYRNPANSNVVAIFEKLQVLITIANSNFVIRLTIADPGDLGSVAQAEQLLDGRSGTNASGSQLHITTETTAAPSQVGQPIAVCTTLLSVPLDYIFTDIQEIHLMPGSAIDFTSGVAVQDLRTNVLYRTRLLEESERA